MKFFDFGMAPNPRRARIFMAEKGIEGVEIIQIDLGDNRENVGDEYRSINPSCTVPALVLEDGTLISESVAICRYFEEVQPNPPLMGRDPKEKAVVEMWQRQVELQGYMPAGEAFRNYNKRFAGRALAGNDSYEQIPELVTRSRTRVERFFNLLNDHMESRKFIASDIFSIADITAYVMVDFAGWSKMGITESQTHLKRWYENIKARPSSSA
ncbi:MAG: glutathione S-transferase [Rhodospirillaceae bacterium]|nr:glutathione S-transferase [Rhodospirillaceae bacterium]|tara:strand:- start:266 stop:901 length:636 start_codon:yes stop_codon:yes gene_type:complete